MSNDNERDDNAVGVLVLFPIGILSSVDRSLDTKILGLGTFASATERKSL